MLQTCPACHAKNSDTAKFCDQCGAPLHPAGETADQLPVAAAAPVAPAAPAAATAKAGGSVNWTALLFLLVIAMAIYWIVKPPQEGGPAPSGMTGAGGDPMASMENVQKQIGEHKKKLDKDPLNVSALGELYGIYMQVGQVEKVHPYVTKALAAWKKKYPKPDDEAKKLLAGLALAALQARDDDSAVEVLLAYHDAEPDNLGVIATIGNLYYEISNTRLVSDKKAAQAAAEKSVEWYGRYLEKAIPAEQGSDYWNVLVDQATMHLQLSGNDKGSAHYASALANLQRTNKEAPEHWAGWYNLGQTHAAVGDKQLALAAYGEALERAGDDEELKWQAQNQIALLKGETPPPMPESMSNPHGEMGAGDGMSLPKPPPGTPNPHGEGFGSGSGGMANPHGEMANPHGETK